MADIYSSKYIFQIIYYGILIYIASLVFEAPIRFILHSWGMEYLLYLRDIFLIISIAIYIFKTLKGFTIDREFLIVTLILTFHSIVALFFLNNYIMIIFAWKVYLPLLFGILYGHLFFSNLRSTVRIFSVLLFCAIAGVLINYYQEFPWEALEYSLGGISIDAVKLYRTLLDLDVGVRRLSGFSRDYLNNALQILLLAIFLISYSNNKFFKVIIWVGSGLAIFLTTAKGPIVTYLLVSTFLLFYRFIPNYLNVYQKSLFVFTAIGIGAPFLSYFMSQPVDIPIVLLSMYERIFETWPDVFELMKNHGNLILGRGFGGMGASQLFFEIDKINPGDNVFMMFYGNFGLFGILYLLFMVTIAQPLELKTELFYYLFIFSFFCIGITSSTIDVPLFVLFLGVYLKYMKLSYANYSIREKYILEDSRINA